MFAEIKARPGIESTADVLDEAPVGKTRQVGSGEPRGGKVSGADEALAFDKGKSRLGLLTRSAVPLVVHQFLHTLTRSREES